MGRSSDGAWASLKIGRMAARNVAPVIRTGDKAARNWRKPMQKPLGAEFSPVAPGSLVKES
jgi:hypothetical protein